MPTDPEHHSDDEFRAAYIRANSRDYPYESGGRPMTPMAHWLTTFDPDDGEPIGEGCNCEIGDDHDGKGNLIDPSS